MTTDPDYGDLTTEGAVTTFKSASPIFETLLVEVKVLSKKKPESTLNAGKVRIINRVLNDVLSFLHQEPTGKYLEVLSDDALPQVSDAVLTMVQFETALNAFESRYRRRVEGEWQWMTFELVQAIREDDNAAGEDEDEEDGVGDEDEDEDEDEVEDDESEEGGAGEKEDEL